MNPYTVHAIHNLAMKLSAEHYAVLSPLLDEALRLDDAARLSWLAQLPAIYAGYRPALHRILVPGAESSLRLDALELRLRNCRREVAVLVLAEFDRRQ